MGNLDELLESLGETGEASVFLVDQQRASQLLTETWSNQSPRSVYPLHLLASAVSSGASRLRCSRRPSLAVHLKNLLFQDRWGFAVEHDGEPPCTEDLRRLQDLLQEKCHPATRYLAMACQVAQTLYKSRVCVEACRGRILDRLIVKNGIWRFFGGARIVKAFEGVRFRVEFGQGSFCFGEEADDRSSEEFLIDRFFDKGQEFRALRSGGQFAPLKMTERGEGHFSRRRICGSYWEESRASAIHADLAARPSPHDFSVLVEVVEGFGEWVFMRHGVVLEIGSMPVEARPEMLHGVRIIASSNLFGIDASHRQVIANAYFRSVVVKCLEMLEALLRDLDLRDQSNRECVKKLLVENSFSELLPGIYHLPVFQTIDGRTMGASTAQEMALKNPALFSRSELAQIQDACRAQSPTFLFGQGFSEIVRIQGEGRYLLCSAENEVAQGVLDCQLQEFRDFGLAHEVLIPGTSTLFSCGPNYLQTRDLESGESDFHHLDLGCERPLLGATPKLGVILSGGTLYKWNFRQKELVKECPFDGDFEIVEHWCEGVLLLRGTAEWGLFDTAKESWLLREPVVEDRLKRSICMGQDGTVAVEERPEIGADGEWGVRVYRYKEGGLHLQDVSWSEWAISRRSGHQRAVHLGAGRGEVYQREDGCLWSETADSDRRRLARNDGIRDVVLDGEYLAWATEAGCHVICRESGRLTFIKGAFLEQRCLVLADETRRFAFRLLHPLTGEGASSVSLSAFEHNCPDHLALWASQGEFLLCQPRTGSVITRCPAQTGQYWLNEKWILRYTQQWSVRAADQNDWSRVALPAPEEQTGVTLLDDFLVLERGKKQELVLHNLVDGGKSRTFQGRLLAVSHRGGFLAFLKGTTIRLFDLAADSLFELAADGEKSAAADIWVDDVHALARFIEPDRFAHPWIGVVRRDENGWNVTRPAWLEPREVQVDGDCLYTCGMGSISFFDFQTSGLVATLHGDGSDWFFFTPLGLYDCSEGGEGLLRSDIDREALKSYRRKGLMSAVLAR